MTQLTELSVEILCKGKNSLLMTEVGTGWQKNILMQSYYSIENTLTRIKNCLCVNPCLDLYIFHISPKSQLDTLTEYGTNTHTFTSQPIYYKPAVLWTLMLAKLQAQVVYYISVILSFIWRYIRMKKISITFYIKYVYCVCVSGYICPRSDLMKNGCCDPDVEASKRYLCDTCKTNNCCVMYENCVSCCLDPRKVNIVLLNLHDFFRPWSCFVRDAKLFCPTYNVCMMLQNLRSNWTELMTDDLYT